MTSLWTDHYEDLCQYALRYLESPEDAEDAVADVFFRLYRREANNSGADRPVSEGYLFRSVRNEALHRHARRRIAQEASRMTQWEELRRVCAPDDQYDLHVRSAAVRQAVDDLPPRCREAFVLVRLDGCTYGAAAAAMGVSIKTVEEQLRRAKRRLQESLATYADGD